MALKHWTRTDDKRFEEALVRFPEDFPNRFENIANNLQMPFEDVMHYYDALVHDIDLIESGQYDTINYPDYSGGISSQTKHIEKDRKRGIPWTEDEHKYFLEGLKMYGKGDWKSISRFILTRTPTQVASHAQKYFLRQSVDSKTKKRSSIHDITSVNHVADNVTVPQSNFDSTMDQPYFSQQMSSDYHHSPDEALDDNDNGNKDENFK